MYRNNGPMILASGSPRRKQYLQDMGLEFQVVAAEIEEERLRKELPGDFVCRMAREKSIAVSKLYRDAWVVSGDTIVCLGEKILGKPQSQEDAVSILMQLSGREHTVMTGFCVSHHGRQIQIIEAVTTRVVFADFSEEVARGYVATGEPLDKAGAYGIQGKGAVLVKSIEGSYTNVVGLPLYELLGVLKKIGAVQV